jgi:hypothetical protein
MALVLFDAIIGAQLWLDWPKIGRKTTIEIGVMKPTSCFSHKYVAVSTCLRKSRDFWGLKLNVRIGLRICQQSFQIIKKLKVSYKEKQLRGNPAYEKPSCKLSRIHIGYAINELLERRLLRVSFYLQTRHFVYAELCSSR